MKQKIAYQLAILFILMSTIYSCAIAAEQMPEKGWLVNTWKGTAAAAISFDTAPDNTTAVRVKFSGQKQMANVSLPKDYVAASAKNWPSRFKGFQIYVWNDGEVRTIRLNFVAAVEVDGKQTTLPFVSLMKVDHKGWKLLTQQTAINFQHRQAKLIPSRITSIYFSVDRPAEIALGAITWTADGEELRRLDEGNSATIFKTNTPPVIDGNDNDAAWKNAAEITLSHVLRSSDKPQNTTTARLLFDDENLYILTNAPFTNRAKMKINAREHDANVWDDECIEVMLYPGIDTRKYAQFIINPNGVTSELSQLFDQVEDRITMKFKDWNPQWQRATKMGASSWTAEIRIPWKIIDNGARPSLMQLQIGHNDTTAGQYALWAPSALTPASGKGVAALNDDRGNGKVTVSNIALQRDPHNDYHARAMALADQPLDGLTVKTYFCAPRSEPEISTQTFSTAGNSASIEFPIPSTKILNGKYFVAMEFIPGNKKLAVTGTAYFFNQLLPSTVKFSDVIFNPEPKTLAWKDGTFLPKTTDFISVDANATERTVKTARYLAEKINGVYGFMPPVRKGQKGRLELSIKSTFVKQKTGSDSPEAYTLDVTPQHISIVGADEAGLYYGVVTLLQLMHGSKLPDAPMRSLSITDWPSYPHRVIATYLQFQLKKDNGANGGLQIARYKDWIERIVAGNKFNTLFLTWGDQINYPSVPEVHDKNNFSPAEIADLFNFARDHFIEASPGILFGAHSATWSHHFPQLMEPGWSNIQMDVTLPETYSLLDRLFGDLMNIAGPQSRYLMNQNDEWWHAGQDKTNFIYKGKNRQQLMDDYLMKAHQFITSKGKQMVMFDDMLLPKHNGGPPWNLSAITDRLPKDIVMATWSDSNDFLTEKGFKNTWTVYNGFVGDSRRPNASDNGYGQIFYPLFQSLFNQTDQNRTLDYSYLTTLPAANYAWNKETKGVLPTQDWVLQKMPAFLGSLSFKPDAAAGDTLTPLAIPESAKIPELEQIKKITSAGEIPVKAGAVLATPTSPVEIALPQGTKASAFYILSAVYPNAKTDVAKLQNAYRKDPRSRPYGLIVGKYRINYADGAHAEMYLRLGRSIALFQYTPAPSRYGQEIRAVAALSENQEQALTQYEMVNPHPEKEVKSFEVEGNFDDAPLLVAGITARSVR